MLLSVDVLPSHQGRTPEDPAGTLQPLAIPEWKWDKVEMDFITGFPISQKGHDAIFVVIDSVFQGCSLSTRQGNHHC